MYCSFGDKIATLVVYPDRTVYLSDSPMANISDHISLHNIQCFGKCHTTGYPSTGNATSANHGKLTPMPCVPGTVFEWEGKGDYIVRGKAAIQNTSYCRCKWGGIIHIIHDGQKPETFDAAYYEQILADNFKEKAPVEEEKHPWLDMAEYIPVAGSILGMIRAITGNKGHKEKFFMFALNLGFLVLDIAGLFTFGATTAASMAAKAGTKAAIKATGKYLLKETATGVAVDLTVGLAIDKGSKLMSKEKGGRNGS